MAGSAEPPRHQRGRALSAALGDASSRMGIVSARAQVQEYAKPYDDYCDLIDLCEILRQTAAGAAVGSACEAVIHAALTAVIESGAKGKDVANSRGVSIYFPKRKISPLYATLDFVKKNAWTGFIADFVAVATRRPG